MKRRVKLMKKNSFWWTLASVVVAAVVAAAVAYLIYYYRDNVRSALSQVKDKGKKLLNSFCEDAGDFAEL